MPKSSAKAAPATNSAMAIPHHTRVVKNFSSSERTAARIRRRLPRSGRAASPRLRLPPEVRSKNSCSRSGARLLSSQTGQPGRVGDLADQAQVVGLGQDLAVGHA